MGVKGAWLAAGLTIVAAGCQTPPTTEVNAARASIDAAATAGADEYAPESLKAAEEARNALDLELQAQDGKWVKSYDRVTQLAAEAKAAGERAAAHAAEAKRKADVAAQEARRRTETRAAAKANAVRVGGQVAPPVKIKDVQPVYPAIAKSARVAGAVVIEATVDADGNVADARIVRSVPLLDQAALDAVEQWKYKPSIQNGKAVPVVMTVTVNFAL